MEKDKITGAVHTNGFFTVSGHPQVAGQMVSANSGDASYSKTTGVYTRSDNQRVTDNKDFYHAVGSFNEEQYSYITATKRDARDLFNTIIYRFEPDKPKYDFTEVTALCSNDDDGMFMLVAATFEDREEAEKFFKKYPKTVDMDNEDKGEEKSYSYFIAFDETSYTRNVAVALYMSGNTVIWIRTGADDCEMVENFCDYFKLISPLDA